MSQAEAIQTRNEDAVSGKSGSSRTGSDGFFYLRTALKRRLL